MSKRLKFPYYKEPPKGWHWIREGVKFAGKSPEEVVEKVRKSMIANGQPPIDLMDQYVEYVAENWPQLVLENTVQSSPVLKYSLLDVFKSTHTLGMTPLVNAPDKDEIERRQKVCKDCPFNHRLRGDSDLMDEVNRRAYLLTKGKLANVGYCKHRMWDNRVATMWDLALLEKINPAENAPALCWASPSAHT